MPIFNGTAGPDTLNGTSGDDEINGLGGDDVLNGLGGIDLLNGGDDNDFLYGGNANDILNGGSGNDNLDGQAGADAMTGGAGNDVYFVDNAGDTFIELAGGGIDSVYTQVDLTLAEGAEIEVVASQFNDVDITGNSSENTIYGRGDIFGLGGNDVLIALSMNHIVNGGQGNDYLSSLFGPNTLIGGVGDDIYLIGDEISTVVEAAGEGRDVVYVAGTYTLAAGVEVEVLSAANALGGGVRLIGNEFSHELYGSAGADELTGGVGNDILISFDGPDELRGGDGNDQLFAGEGADRMFGGIGNDIYHVDNSGDTVTEAAAAGRDVVYSSVNFALADGNEIEVLSTASQSGAARIDLSGNNLANDIYGNNGINYLNGGLGNDYLYGFGGVDRFIFDSTLGAGNVDTIGDFQSGVDVFQLAFDLFRGNNFGTLAASSFVTGSAAADADDRIIYNSATGAILYDADGTGATAAVQFAIVTPGITLVASDFITI
jgi:Ca2+-binding RTX toxin-like protein